jgi:signal transduction histidine kinase
MVTITIAAASLIAVIPSTVERNLIDERVVRLSNLAAELSRQGLVPGTSMEPAELAAFDALVHGQYLGADTVRVKVWGPEGELLYTDAPVTESRTLSTSAPMLKALGGSVAVAHVDLASPEHVYEQDLGHLVEFYIPVADQGGAEGVTVFEFYQNVAPMVSTVSDTRRYAWIGTSLVVATLAICLIAMMAYRARVLNRRMRNAEELAGDLARAQDQERKRIVGALHDDIGQPIYRVLYGLQGCRAQLARGQEAEGSVTAELSALEGLVRSIDSTLKTELRLLHADAMTPLAGDDLESLLGELVEQVTRETSVRAELDIGEYEALTPLVSMTLFRAAREALTNARRHSGALRVWVRLFSGNDRVILDVEDDGPGQDVEPGLGLITTRERLEAIGGGITVSSGPGHGTLFRAWAPTEAATT